MAELITGAALIGNQDFLPAAERFDAYDPATGTVLGPDFRASGAADVTLACDLAEAGFDAFRQRPYAARAAFLNAVAAEILALGDQLIQRAMAETGLTEARLLTERARTCGQLELFARVVERGDWLDLRLDHAQPERKPLPRSEFRLRQIPLGPVAVFGSSNFPLAFSTAGGDTASAFAAGCPVVVKGHPAHAGTGELVARAVRRAAQRTNMPEGVFSYLPGEVLTGAELVKNSHIKAVGFTGSRNGGLALVKIAAARPEPIPVYAEMSSINPVLLFPAALQHRSAALAQGYVGSLTQGAGQFCTNPGLVLALDTPALGAFFTALTGELHRHDPSVMLTAGIHAAFERGRDALQASPGVEIIAQSLPATGPNRGRAAVFKTDYETFVSNETLEREVFGASSLIVVCKDKYEMAKAIVHIEGQLTFTLQLDPDDYQLAKELMPALERKAGRILANDWPTGVEVTDAMVHGGPFPATSNTATTSVGTLAIRRFLRPVSYQSLPDELLPTELQDTILASMPHLLDGEVRVSGEA